MIHSGVVNKSEVWGAGIHIVRDTLLVGGDSVRAVLTINPGATICFAAGSIIRIADGSFITHNGGLLKAVGRSDSPILFTSATPGTRWGGLLIQQIDSGAESEITNAVVENGTFGVRGEGLVNLDRVSFRNITSNAVYFWYYNDTGVIRNSTVDSAGQDGSAAVSLEAGTIQNTTIRGSGGVGVSIRARFRSANVDSCTVIGSGKDGVSVDPATATPLSITHCNLESNAGLGIGNYSNITVDARDNWWGDPAGPFGAAGDGVSNKVTYLPFRMQRY